MSFGKQFLQQFGICFKFCKGIAKNGQSREGHEGEAVYFGEKLCSISRFVANFARELQENGMILRV